jgi:hypothetical protein
MCVHSRLVESLASPYTGPLLFPGLGLLFLAPVLEGVGHEIDILSPPRNSGPRLCHDHPGRRGHVLFDPGSDR